MENKKSHYFYVLLCQDGSFYGGYTTEPERRLAKRRPVKMIHTEKFETRSAATKAEAAFKKLTRKQKEQYLKTFH